MCGIFAILLKRPLNNDDVEAGRKCLAKLEHRGPDNHGEWIDRKAGVFLGHRRLSIIDLSDSSAQPITSGKTSFIFNGEIYNFLELKNQLSKENVSFVSQGDGEVFFKGLKHWGKNTFNKVDGMFSMVCWDSDVATLAVDSFGEKPLFYAETDDGVYVSSELPPLVELLNIKPELSEENWVAYMSLGFIPQPETFYPNVYVMRPGTYREIRKGALQKEHVYWSIPNYNIEKGLVKPINEREIDNISDVLIQSIKRRLVADVPLTLFLSAGIDSTLIAALCRYELKTDLDCLTVAFSDGNIRDESQMASRIAKHLGFNHRIIANHTKTSSQRIVELLGQPSGNVGILPLEQVCRDARNSGYTVALTGMGGDEVTWGYGKHAYYWKMRNLYRMPYPLRLMVSRMVSIFGRKGKRIGLRLLPRLQEIYIADKNFPLISLLRQLPDYNDWLDHEFGARGNMWGSKLEYSVPSYELNRVMPAVHLLSSDHASMRHSLELRTPFLNRELVELLSTYDARALLAFGQKDILKRLLYRYMPKELVDFPKTGFTYPREFLVKKEEMAWNLPHSMQDLANVIWKNRFQGEGWLLNAVRLSTANYFFEK